MKERTCGIDAKSAVHLADEIADIGSPKRVQRFRPADAHGPLNEAVPIRDEGHLLDVKTSELLAGRMCLSERSFPLRVGIVVGTQVRTPLPVRMCRTGDHLSRRPALPTAAT